MTYNSILTKKQFVFNAQMGLLRYLRSNKPGVFSTNFLKFLLQNICLKFFMIFYDISFTWDHLSIASFWIQWGKKISKKFPGIPGVLIGNSTCKELTTCFRKSEIFSRDWLCLFIYRNSRRDRNHGLANCQRGYVTSTWIFKASKQKTSYCNPNFEERWRPVLVQVPKYLGRSKCFVADQKLTYILCMTQTFCARVKDNLHSVNSVFVLAQNVFVWH